MGALVGVVMVAAVGVVVVGVVGLSATLFETTV
jgi:hypothetical protein